MNVLEALAVRMSITDSRVSLDQPKPPGTPQASSNLRVIAMVILVVSLMAIALNKPIIIQARDINVSVFAAPRSP